MNKKARRLWQATLLLLCLTPAAISFAQVSANSHGSKRTQTLQVGSGKLYALPSQAAAAARDGDIIEINAGTYDGDVAVWTANDLTLRGVGGRPRLRAGGKSAEGKAIWVIKGNNTTIENIEFAGATVDDHNGAGIRQEGARLTIRNCYFHDNENGILAGANQNSQILIENSEFADNGYGDGRTHNIYIGNIRAFTLQGSYVHHAKSGHNIKSRAQSNYILYNRIMDEKTGTASYEIDIPNGGRSYIIGNMIQKGTRAENSTLISYAAEGAANESQELYVVNNTFVNDRHAGIFVQVRGNLSQARLVNNIFSGRDTVLKGVGIMSHNLVGGDLRFVDKANFNYRLSAGSAAVDAGTDPGAAGEVNLRPIYEYVHPMDRKTRPVVGPIDIGAYEYSKGQ